ncbi:hypothetical protein [uncultured Flavobacterium sp.]|uniref:hypothetical protein n=1 Tax=uncultured Flavobacterium sp. TaxID=165435 RepID=UPI0025CD396D|nr:hypothetical protein [uncultured Flavobacterium sp.]
MKNLLLTGLIIIICSCSNGDFEESGVEQSSKEALHKQSLNPENGADSEKNFKEVAAGNFILLVPAQISGRVILVLQEKRGGKDFQSSEKSLSDTDTISSYQEPVAALHVIVDQSALTSPLKIDVKGYIADLGNLRSASYETVDEFIIQYEISKRQDSTLLEAEKETILNISSISEAVLFSEKSRKDRDWETSTTSKHTGY